MSCWRRMITPSCWTAKKTESANTALRAWCWNPITTGAHREMRAGFVWGTDAPWLTLRATRIQACEVSGRSPIESIASTGTRHHVSASLRRGVDAPRTSSDVAFARAGCRCHRRSMARHRHPRALCATTRMSTSVAEKFRAFPRNPLLSGRRVVADARRAFTWRTGRCAVSDQEDGGARIVFLDALCVTRAAGSAQFYALSFVRTFHVRRRRPRIPVGVPPHAALQSASWVAAVPRIFFRNC